MKSGLFGLMGGFSYLTIPCKIKWSNETDTRERNTMNEKQLKAHQAIQNLMRHVETPVGKDAVTFALRLFDESIQDQSRVDIDTPTRVSIGTSTVDKLPGMFPPRNE